MTKTKKIILLALVLILGLGSIYVAIFVVKDTHKSIAGIMLGIGAAASALSLGGLIQNIFVPKSVLQQQKQQKEIEVNDERNIRIREKAGLVISRIMFYMIIVVLWVFVFMDVAMWIILLMTGILVVYIVMLIVLTNYYSKRM